MLGQRIHCGTIAEIELYLVPPQPEMLPKALEMMNKPEVTQYLSARNGFNLSHEEEWYKKISDRSNHSDIVWAIEFGGEFAGFSGIHFIDWITRTGCTGTVIDTNFWRQGIASAAMRERARCAFEYYNLFALNTVIYVPNTGSRKAAEKAGYVEWGINPYEGYLNGSYLAAWNGVLTRDRWQELHGIK